MGEIQITAKKVREQIKNLRADSAPGPDGISPKVLKELEEVVDTPLAIIFKKSLTEGTVPLDWKIAKVTPIYKKGPKASAGNYRPVSLTSVPCKLMESILKNNIMDHLLKNKLIRPSQHGFMPGKSCASNLTVFLDRATKAVDEGKSVDIFYLDFAKAFDKVPRRRLIAKLQAKGLRPDVTAWISDWLTGRTQRVTVGGSQSGECNVDSGVPQGSVLGPCLFTVFIDDLEVDIELSDLGTFIVKFADDTKGLQEITSDEDRAKMQRALDILSEWADIWGMEFNVEKCKVMHVGKHNPQFEYYMRGTKLKTTEEEKDVGVYVTKNLKPSSQCHRAAVRATAVLNQLKKNFHYRDKRTFVRLYIQYVRPHLEFAAPAWSPWNIGDQEELEQVQQKAVRMVSGLKGTTYEERCEELGIQTLKERRQKQDLTLAHKFVVGGLEGGDMFHRLDQPGRITTRQAGDPGSLATKYARTDTRKYSFGLRVTEAWNKLDSETRNSATSKQFKARLKAKGRLAQ
jgi:hypothetical protein